MPVVPNVEGAEKKRRKLASVTCWMDTMLGVPMVNKDGDMATRAALPYAFLHASSTKYEVAALKELTYA